MQFVIFKPLSYCFEETIGRKSLVCKSSNVASNQVIWQTRWYNKRILKKGYSVPRDFSWIENYKLNVVLNIELLLLICFVEEFVFKYMNIKSTKKIWQTQAIAVFAHKTSEFNFLYKKNNWPLASFHMQLKYDSSNYWKRFLFCFVMEGGSGRRGKKQSPEVFCKISCS